MKTADKKSLVPEKLVEIIKKILINRGDAIDVELIPNEYEHITEKKFSCKEWKINSLYDLASVDEFHFMTLKNGQSILYLESAKNDIERMNNVISSKDELIHFSSRVKKNMSKLLDQYYFDGLTIDEFPGAYLGLIDVYGRADITPSNYNLNDLSELLAQEKNVCKIVVRKGQEYVVSSAFCQVRYSDDQELEVPRDAVPMGNKFTTKPITSVFREGGAYDVWGGDTYSADQFYIRLHGKSTSTALESLLDHMMLFYNSSIRQRYKINKMEKILATPHYPVAIRYKYDAMWYRGFVKSVEDINSYKVYFVDFGCHTTAFEDEIYFLHNEFLELPVQAYKCALYGIKPTNDRYYTALADEMLRSLAKDTILNILVKEIEHDTLKVLAFHVPQVFKDDDLLDLSARTEDNTYSINSALVLEKKAVFDNTLLTNVQIENLSRSIGYLSIYHRMDYAKLVGLEHLLKKSNPTAISPQTQPTAPPLNQETTASTNARDTSVTVVPVQQTDSQTSSFQENAKTSSFQENVITSAPLSYTPKNQTSTSITTPINNSNAIFNSDNSPSKSSNQLENESVVNQEPKKPHKKPLNIYSWAQKSAKLLERSNAARMNSDINATHNSLPPTDRSSVNDQISDVNNINLHNRSVQNVCIGASSSTNIDRFFSDSGTQRNTNMGKYFTESGASTNTSLEIASSTTLFPITESVPVKTTAPITCSLLSARANADHIVRALKIRERLYIPVQEMSKYIPKEQIERALDIIVGMTSENYADIQSFPDIFLLLQRDGVDYLIVEDHVITRIQIVEWDAAKSVLEDLAGDDNKKALLEEVDSIFTKKMNGTFEVTEIFGDQLAFSFKRAMDLESSKSSLNSNKSSPRSSNNTCTTSSLQKTSSCLDSQRCEPRLGTRSDSMDSARSTSSGSYIKPPPGLSLLPNVRPFQPRAMAPRMVNPYVPYLQYGSGNLMQYPVPQAPQIAQLPQYYTSQGSFQPYEYYSQMPETMLQNRFYRR